VTGIAEWALGLDEFDVHARYRPGLLAILPLPITGVALGLDKQPVIATLLSLAVAVGLPRLLVQVVRDLGTAAQDRLWASWGGKPTTQMLRWSDTSTSAADKARWHAVLGAAAGVQLPSTALVEAVDPSDADARYEQVVAFAREETRGNPLLLGENRSYNYERNIYGLRPVALALALLGIVVLVGALVLQARAGSAVEAIAVCLAANIIVALGWWWVPSERRVKVMADKYALQLLNTATHQTLTGRP
jgi:hypothetical protein